MTLARSPMKKATTRKCGCPSNLGVGRHRRSCTKWKPAPKPKARKPIPHRNQKRRPADLATAQREACLERDGHACVIEVVRDNEWTRCGSRRYLQAAHVVRRHLAGDAIYDVDVVVTACSMCHNTVDHRAVPWRWDTARFPEDAVARAIACVKRYENERAARGKAVVRLKGAK